MTRRSEVTTSSEPEGSGACPVYSGAVGKVIARDAVDQLGAGYVLQPKADGWYGTVSFGPDGYLSKILTRSGKAFGSGIHRDSAGGFSDIRWVPNSIVTAEVEIGTEASNEAARLRGYRRLYLFDALTINGRDLTAEVQATRRDILYRAHVERELDDRSDVRGVDHDVRTKRFVRAIGDRVVVVPQMPSASAKQAWSSWVDGQQAGPCEGLVAVATQARLGGKRAKVKVKESTTIDCVVSSVSPRALTVYWPQAQRTITVSRQACDVYEPGEVIELAHEGFYNDGLPRFARITRHRWDLSA